MSRIDSVLITFIIAHPDWRIEFKFDTDTRVVQIRLSTSLTIGGNTVVFDQCYVSVRELGNVLSADQFLSWFLDNSAERFNSHIQSQIRRSGGYIPPE